jgi:hypothetical protein
LLPAVDAGRNILMSTCGDEVSVTMDQARLVRRPPRQRGRRSERSTSVSWTKHFRCALEVATEARRPPQ